MIRPGDEDTSSRRTPEPGEHQLMAAAVEFSMTRIQMYWER
jgi:hypothetical protein